MVLFKTHLWLNSVISYYNPSRQRVPWLAGTQRHRPTASASCCLAENPGWMAPLPDIGYIQGYAAISVYWWGKLSWSLLEIQKIGFWSWQDWHETWQTTALHQELLTQNLIRAMMTFPISLCFKNQHALTESEAAGLRHRHENEQEPSG